MVARNNLRDADSRPLLHGDARSEEHTSELQSPDHLVLHSFPTRRSSDLACLATATMLFGGFMFGPDLDIQSKQYTRWRIFRFLWFPYKVMFKHRSRWSHGIIFGTLIRVLYFTGMLDRKSTRLNSSHQIISFYTLSLHDALPISLVWRRPRCCLAVSCSARTLIFNQSSTRAGEYFVSSGFPTRLCSSIAQDGRTE